MDNPVPPGKEGTLLYCNHSVLVVAVGAPLCAAMCALCAPGPDWCVLIGILSVQPTSYLAPAS